MTTHTALLTVSQAKALQSLLEARGWEQQEKQYCLFSARHVQDKVNVAVYEKGPKIVVQGKGTAEFVQFILEPEILGVARLDYGGDCLEQTEVKAGKKTGSNSVQLLSSGGKSQLDSEQLVSHFGIDESGKGDVFGPLVVAAVHTEGEVAQKLANVGLMDSKKIGTDKRIVELANEIRRSGVAFEVVLISPQKYNQLYPQFGSNLNRLLAWGHARAIASLAEKVPDCKHALSDQFAKGPVLNQALARFPQAAHISLKQRTKAESDIAVAAASILAREKFIAWLQEEGYRLGITLPRGASAKVSSVLQKLQNESQSLENLVKMHFRTVQLLTK